MGKREDYLQELKKETDKIREKDPSERTYMDRWILWHEKNMLQEDPGDPYDVGEEREFYDGQKLANNEEKAGNGADFPDWFQEMGRHFGEKCKTPYDNTVYTLIGMSETFEDYYYILQEENGSKLYLSCVGGLDFI